MSFPFHAGSFAPVSEAYLPSKATEHTAGALGAKKSVCMAFYKSGGCPYLSHCEHAHHFTELCAETQMELLGSMPVGSIPAHFFDVSQSREERLIAPSSEPLKTSMVGCGHFNHVQTGKLESTVSSRRHPTGKYRELVVSHLGPQQPILDVPSFSSRTSSSAESLSLGGVHFSNGSSPPTIAVATTVEVGVFKMTLPLRCRYPHSSIPGTYYDVLALPRDAPHSDIIAKYRAWQRGGFKRMRQVDPVGAEAVDRIIVEARNVLGNPILRAAYNQQLPSAPVKQQSWAATSCGAGLTSRSTTPSKHHTQGLSSTTSSAFDTHHRLDESYKFIRHSRSNSGVYHVDGAAPVVTITSLHNGESIW
ncbi:hypothetical protein JKF63_01026 [Porcisia hertigi]|uniref:C3H1-type domain-containing protein n=1 Tax=Porcisia hertigi TaxID=2761500 RepID=A0A836IDM2_9TRYP|nr:hypothetical protein JKF63_01026 [Porcisia hertigi]